MKRTKQLTCPTCGCPVKIGGEGTTHYYIPILPEAVQALVKEAGWAEHFLPKDAETALSRAVKAVEKLMETK